MNNAMGGFLGILLQGFTREIENREGRLRAIEEILGQNLWEIRRMARKKFVPCYK